MSTRLVPWSLGALCLVALGLSGCGRSDGLITVSGTVTLDGQPVETGSISLMPVDGKGMAGGGVITDGRFSADTVPGEIAVQIHAHKTVQKENPTQEEIERNLTEMQVPLLPAVYNRQSKLRIDVAPDNRRFDFNLTSDGKIPEGMNVDTRKSAG